MSADSSTIARNGAVIEANFDDLAGHSRGREMDIHDIPELKGYKVLEVKEFDNPDNPQKGNYKAMVLQDPDGNIYIHFRGTGDGNWLQNDAAYGPEPSQVQEWAHEYCDHMIERYGGSAEEIYITGHSQGGNNTQYAMLTTKYPDRITMAVSLDGQGFSHEVAQQIRERYGEAGYQERAEKLYAYNGAYDFVSPLGQEQLVPGDHTYMVELSDGYHTGDEGVSVRSYHDVRWMLDEDGNLGPVHPYNSPDNGESGFRKLILDLNGYLNLLPAGIQADVASRAMKLAEYFMPGPNGNIQGDLGLQDICRVVELLIPLLLVTVITNPGDLVQLLAEYGVFDKLANLVKEHPLLAVVMILYMPALIEVLKLLGIAVGVILAVVEVLAILVDIAITVFSAIKEFCDKAIAAIKSAVNAVKQWARNTFNKGVSYVRDHPSFSCDPDALERLADRLSNIQARLMRLDSDMNTLYWQVGFLDLLDILHANLVTGGSPTLFLAECYLRNAASRIRSAENQAAAIMGG